MTEYSYPLAHPNFEFAEMNAITDTLRASRTTCGPRVAEFEQAFALYVGREHAVMVNSGSSADMLIAYALGTADRYAEILVPAVTWPTHVFACLLAGYRVRLVDVNPATLQFSMEDLREKVNNNVAAVFPVHVLGNMGDMDALVDFATVNHIPILEDCCEALSSRWHGGQAGTFGDAAAYSFFFSHLLNTMEGGMVVTDSQAAARQYRLLRSHGWEPQEEYHFWFPSWGFNVRPTELQGAVGCVQIKRLGFFIAARVANAGRLTRYFDEYRRCFDKIVVDPRCDPVWHGYPVMVNAKAPFARAELCRYFEERGIETRPIIAGNLARQPMVQDDPRVICGPLPGADAVHDRGFYIGLASYDDERGTDYVGRTLAEFMDGR